MPQTVRTDIRLGIFVGNLLTSDTGYQLVLPSNQCTTSFSAGLSYFPVREKEDVRLHAKRSAMHARSSSGHPAYL